MAFYQRLKERLGKVFIALLGRNRFYSFLSGFFGRLLWPPVAVAVIAGDGSSICVLEYRGRLRLPSGLVEYGENPREAATREFREETGRTVEIEEFEGAVVTGRTNAVLLVYSGDIGGGEFHATWEGQPLMVDRGEAAGREWDEDMSEALKYL